MNAIALNSSLVNFARIVGPALAGLLIARVGLSASFLLNGASFLAVIAGLALIRTPAEGRGLGFREPEKSLGEEVAAGLRYIRRTPVVLSAVLLMALLNIFAMNFNVLVPVFARDTLGKQAAGYGFLMSASGLGALCGAVVLATFSRRRPRLRLLFASGAGLCLFQLLLALSRCYSLALLLLGLAGWSWVTFIASVNTTVQLNVPDDLRGRVMSVYSLVFAGMTPLGSLLAGSLAHAWGAPASFAVGASLGLLSLLAVARFAWRRAGAPSRT